MGYVRNLYFFARWLEREAHMLKKALCVTASALLALSLYACGASGGNQGAPNSGAAEGAQAQEELQYYVDHPIDYTLDGGNVRFNHVEKANAQLTSEDNVLLFVFDFTNAMSDPAEFQRVFRVQYFQNGTELTNNLPYSTAGGEQYDLVQAFFNSAMKGGTVTFAQIVAPKDDSPITVMIRPNGGFYSQDEYKMMEVGFGEEPTDVAADTHFYELGKVFKFGPEKAVAFLESKGFSYQEAYTPAGNDSNGTKTAAGWVGNPADNISSDHECVYQLFDKEGNELSSADLASGTEVSRIRMIWYNVCADPPADTIDKLAKDCGFGEAVGKGWLLGVADTPDSMWSRFSIETINGAEGFVELRTTAESNERPVFLIEWSAFSADYTKDDFLEGLGYYSE